MIQPPAARQTRAVTGRLLRFGALVAILTSLIVPLASLAQDDDAEKSIVGEYAVALNRDDIPTIQANAFAYVGRWRIAFNEDGTYFTERLDIGMAASGTYVVDGDSVTITDEAGVLSCSNPSAVTMEAGDVATGTYDWTRNGQELTLVAAEDGCQGRVLLLSTRPLTTFVACTTAPLSDAEMASPAADASPVAAEPTEVVPEPTDDSPLAVLTPDATGGPDVPVVGTPEDVAAVEQAVDELLQQLTSCWATGDPARWLPLLSVEFRGTLMGSDPDFEANLAASMSAPIIWERAGDVDLEDATHASTIVRTKIGVDEDFQRFTFVFEDGEWRWNG